MPPHQLAERILVPVPRQYNQAVIGSFDAFSGFQDDSFRTNEVNGITYSVCAFLTRGLKTHERSYLLSGHLLSACSCRGG